MKGIDRGAPFDWSRASRSYAACQCFVYFDHARLAPAISRALKPGGRFAVLHYGAAAILRKR